MSKLFLTRACYGYDRVRPILDGVVRTKEIDLNFINIDVPDIFWCSLRHNDFDVCEISLWCCLITLERQPQPYIAIPFFRFQSSSTVPRLKPLEAGEKDVRIRCCRHTVG